MTRVHIHVHDAWEEGKHPRGQPGNKGEFTKAKSSTGTKTSTKSSTKPVAESDPEDNIGKLRTVANPIEVYRVVPADVPGSQAFKSQNGKGVYVFTSIEAAREFYNTSGGKLMKDMLKPHKQIMVGDFDIELMHKHSLTDKDPDVFANAGDEEFDKPGTQLYVRNDSLFTDVVSRIGKAK